MAIVHVFISVHFPSSPITKVPEPVRKLSASLCSLCIRQKNDAQSPQFSKGRRKQRISVVNCKIQTASSNPGLQRFFFFWILISKGRRVHFCLSGSSHELVFLCDILLGLCYWDLYYMYQVYLILYDRVSMKDTWLSMIYCLLCITTMFKVIIKSHVNSALTLYYMIDVIFSSLGTWGDGSGVKTTYGPCRGLKFGS